MNTITTIPRVNTIFDLENECNLNSWIAQSIAQRVQNLLELPPVANIIHYREARYVFGWEYRSENVSNQRNSDIWSWNYMRYDTTFAVDNEIRYYDVTPSYCIMRGMWMAKESVCSIMSEAQLTS